MNNASHDGPTCIYLPRHKQSPLRLVKQLGLNIFTAQLSGDQKLDLLAVEAKSMVERKLGMDYGLLLVYRYRPSFSFTPGGGGDAVGSGSTQDVVVYHHAVAVGHLYKTPIRDAETMLTITRRVLDARLKSVENDSHLLVYYRPGSGWEFEEVFIPNALRFLIVRPIAAAAATTTGTFRRLGRALTIATKRTLPWVLNRWTLLVIAVWFLFRWLAAFLTTVTFRSDTVVPSTARP